MDFTLLDTLRYKIEFAKDLGEVYTYFFDNFGENSEFLDASIPTQHELLQSIIEQIGKVMLGKNMMQIRSMRLQLISDYNFIHGSCVLDRHLATIIYFDDIKKGVLAVTNPQNMTKTEFYRFSAEIVNPSVVRKPASFKH